MNHNIFRIKSDDSIVCRFYCIAFIEYMIEGKTLLDYTNLFSLYSYKKNEKIIYRYFKYKYGKENVSLDFILKNNWWDMKLCLRRNKTYELMIEKHKKKCGALNYFEHFLVFASTVNGHVSISVFASLIGVPVGILSSAIGLKMCALTAGSKKYKSIIKKKKKKHDKIMLFAN